MTVERFISLFEVNRGDRGDRERSLSIATLLEETFHTPAGRTHPQDSCALTEDEGRGKADNHNTRTFKDLLEKIERVQMSYGNAQA
jgi:hypothetical protein